MLLLKSLNARVTLCPLSKWLRKKSPGEHFPRYKTNTPRKVFCTTPNLSLKKTNLPLPKDFCQNICNLLISGNVLQCHCSSLNIISNEMIPDLKMVWAVMKNWILWELDATLITIHQLDLEAFMSCITTEIVGYLILCWFLFLGDFSLSHLKGGNKVTLALNDLRWAFNLTLENKVTFWKNLSEVNEINFKWDLMSI